MDIIRPYINEHTTLLITIIGLLLMCTWIYHMVWGVVRYLGYGTIIYLLGDLGYKNKDRLIFETTRFLKYLSLHATYTELLIIGSSIIVFSLLFLMFKYYKKNNNIVDRFLNDRYGDIVDNKQLLISCLVKDLIRAEDELRHLKKLD